MKTWSALFAVAILAATSIVAAGNAEAARITVIKGGKSSVVDTAKTAKRRTVIRSLRTKPARQRGEFVFAPVRRPSWRLVGGRNVWFYNRERGLLIGCRLRGTGVVGDSKRVACSRARTIH